jgi:hypothetical protein
MPTNARLCDWDIREVRKLIAITNVQHLKFATLWEKAIKSSHFKPIDFYHIH